MTKKKNNIASVVKNNLCLHCGICVGVCPTNSIAIEQKNNRFTPNVNHANCISDKGCTRCLDTCPGLGVNLKSISSSSQLNDKNLKTHPLIGKYHQCYTGYSTDEKLRYHGASGGSLSQFLIWLLEKEIINGAVVTQFDVSDKYLVNTFIAKTKDDILSAKSSKYSPVSMHQVIQAIKNENGKYVIVGLPCHIQGFRKYETIDKRFKLKIAGYFSLYCSGGRTFSLTEFVLKQNAIPKNKLSYLAYRDEGCLGNLVAKYDSKKIIIPYKKYYHPLRSFFIPQRCLTCIDLYGELSDVSYGDIHLGKFKEEKIGVNSIIVRNNVFNKYIKQAGKEDTVKLEYLDSNYLVQAQTKMNRRKKRSVATFLYLEKMFGKKTPKYDVKLNDEKPLKSAISYFGTKTQMFIGNHKSLWFIIKFITNLKK
jgi:coenzyme F420 hydrogenase subunit beta